MLLADSIINMVNGAYQGVLDVARHTRLSGMSLLGMGGAETDKALNTQIMKESSKMLVIQGAFGKKLTPAETQQIKDNLSPSEIRQTHGLIGAGLFGLGLQALGMPAEIGATGVGALGIAGGTGLAGARGLETISNRGKNPNMNVNRLLDINPASLLGGGVGGGGSNLKIGGVFGTDLSMQIISLNTEMVDLLQQLVINTTPNPAYNSVRSSLVPNP